MMLWKSFGASVIGPGHIAAGKPNQDAWLAFHHVWGDGIVVSDGLGSSRFPILAAMPPALRWLAAANACRDKTEIDHGFLSNRIKTNWLSLIVPLEPHDCAATCLFAFRLGDGTIHLGMLGDGLAAAVKADGSIVSLSEDKSQGFSNITIALSPNSAAKDWRHLSLPEEECAAVLLCTDGVADDLDNVDGFVKGFIEAHRALAAVSHNRHIRDMLGRWPTPNHSDDKTIACLSGRRWRMDRSKKTQAPTPISDEYGNLHYLADELARGGQGVVFRTRDADLAIKQPLDASGQPDKNANLRDRFQNIRLLPMPSHIPVSLPLAILRNVPGYVMRLLGGMKIIRRFRFGRQNEKEIGRAESGASPMACKNPGQRDGVGALLLRRHGFHSPPPVRTLEMRLHSRPSP